MNLEFTILLSSAIAFSVYGFWGTRNSIRKNIITKIGAFRIAAGLGMSFIGGAATIAMAGIGYANGWIGLVDPIAVVFGGAVVVLFMSWSSRPNIGQGTSNFLAGGDTIRTMVYASCSLFVYALLGAAQIVALQKIFAPYISNYQSLFFAIALFATIVGYIHLGGIGAVTRTDVVQFFVVIILFVIPTIYGVLTLFSSGQESEPLQQLPLDLRTILLLSLSFLFVPLSQDVWLRIRNAKNDRAAKFGVVGGVFIYGLIVSLAITLGVFSAQFGIKVNDAESILPYFFTSQLGFAGFVTALIILAAVMSTLDSFTFNLTSTISDDIGPKLLTHVNQKTMRLFVSVIVFIVCTIIALLADSVLTLVLTALMIYVTVIGPGILLHQFTKREITLWLPALLMLVIILFLWILNINIPAEPYSFLGVHVALIFVMKLFERNVAS